MQAEQLQKVLDLTNRTGETVVVVPDSGEPLVVVPWERYQALSKPGAKTVDRPRTAPNLLATSPAFGSPKKAKISLETDDQFLIEPLE